jgi:ribosome-binding protein aMBF1 (putative translation factor)
LLRKFEGSEESVHEVAVHPDGARALSCSLWNRTIKLWDLGTGRCLRTFEGHGEGISSVAFCPDGRSVLSASWDHTLKVWDLDTGRCLRTLEGHKEQVEAAAMAPGSRRAASWSNDRNLRVWNVETGDCLCTLQVPEVTAGSLAMTPDGRFLISGSTDGMRLWEFDWELDASGRFGAPTPARAENPPSRPVAVPAPPAVEARPELCSFCGTKVSPDKIYLRSSKARLCRECSALCLDVLDGRAPKDANGRRHGPKARAGGNALACSFCGQKTYEMLIAGPGVCACDACIDAGKPVASPPPEPAPRPERIVRAPAPPVSRPPEKSNPVEALRIPAWKINKAMETPALRAAIDGIAGATGIEAKEVCALMLVSAELNQKLPEVLQFHQRRIMYVEEHLGDFRYMLA